MVLNILNLTNLLRLILFPHIPLRYLIHLIRVILQLRLLMYNLTLVHLKRRHHFIIGITGLALECNGLGEVGALLEVGTFDTSFFELTGGVGVEQAAG